MHELETFLEENDFENYQILTNENLELYKNNKIGEIKSIVIENGPELIFEEVLNKILEICSKIDFKLDKISYLCDD